MQQARTAASLTLAALVLAGCGGSRAPVEIDPNTQPIATRWSATLATPAELAGALQVRGTAWMGADPEDSSRTRASVEISNAAPGGEHPWHVHRGRCGMDQGVVGPPKAYKPLEVNGDGQANSSAVLPIPVPTTGDYFVSVHASAANMGTIVACGNLAPPSQ